MSQSSLVYIVLVNFKGWQDTVECLESLFKLSYNNFKVIVVDNNSQNNSIENLESWALGNIELPFDNKFYAYSTVTPKYIHKPILYQKSDAEDIDKLSRIESSLLLIKSKVNLGFAGGNNVGIKLALKHNADFIWLLNNDTVVPAETLTSLVEYFYTTQSNNKPLGVLGAKLLYYHNPSLIQALLGRYNPFMASTAHVGLNQPSDNVPKVIDIKKDDYIVGASMFVSSDYVREVGLMCEEYFLYFEELDWIKRGTEKNYRIDVCLEAIVYHKEGASIGGNNKDSNNKSELSDYYSIRNRFIITKKFYRRFLIPICFSMLLVGANRIKRGQYRRIPLIFKAIQSALKSTN